MKQKSNKKANLCDLPNDGCPDYSSHLKAIIARTTYLIKLIEQMTLQKQLHLPTLKNANRHAYM